MAVLGRLTSRSHLRLRVEATLQQLLNRSINIKQFEGVAQPKSRTGEGNEYALAQEGRGVLGLMTALTYIYDEEIELIIIDEPEINLHPQYQSFLLQEIRQMPNKHAIFATHSPFFIDVYTLDDLKGIVCFHGNEKLPSQYINNPKVDTEVQKLLPHLGAEQRSFYFAQHPVFVEGTSDATLIRQLQRRLGLDPYASNSSILSLSGKDNVARAFALAYCLGKQATAILDLDALFDNRFIKIAQLNPHLNASFSENGYNSLEEAVKELGRDLEALEQSIKKSANIKLQDILKSGEKSKKKWFYLLIALKSDQSSIQTLFVESQKVLNSLNAVINQLEKIGIYVLSQGTLEHYMPSFQGDIYKPKSTAKNNALDEEIQWLSNHHSREEIESRYGDLTRIVQHLPAKYKVNLEPKIKDELAQLLVPLMTGINKGSITQISDISNIIEQRQWLHLQTLFEVKQIELVSPNNFIGEVIVKDCFGLGKMICRFSQDSNPTNPASLNLEKYDA